MVARASLSSESVRAVRHDHGRNTKSGDIPGVPLSFAAKQRGLFFKCKLIN